MPKLTLESLGRKLAERRGSRGIREVAKEIGLSPATLSRVENGHLPDLLSFEKICRWLGIDPADVLGIDVARKGAPAASVHFRVNRALNEETAKALANMILAAQRAMMISSGKDV